MDGHVGFLVYDIIFYNKFSRLLRPQFRMLLLHHFVLLMALVLTKVPRTPLPHPRVLHTWALGCAWKHGGAARRLTRGNCGMPACAAVCLGANCACLPRNPPRPATQMYPCRLSLELLPYVELGGGVAEVFNALRMMLNQFGADASYHFNNLIVCGRRCRRRCRAL